MKKVVFLFVFSLSAITLFAELNDAERVAICPIVPEYEEIPAGARQQLQNKLGTIVSTYGVESSGGTDRFVITAKINVTEHNIIPSNPTRIQQKMDVIIQVGDLIEKKVFASNVVSVTGLGVTEEKSYISAFSRIQVRTSEMEHMVENARQQIIAYYSAKCPEIMQQAKSLAAQQKYTESLTQLALVPNICSECYQQTLDLAMNIYEQQIEKEGKEILQRARSAWSLKQDYGQAEKALNLLMTINPEAPCADEAYAFVNEINEKLRNDERLQKEENDRLKAQQRADELERRAEARAKAKMKWDFMIRKYEDDLTDRRQSYADSVAHSKVKYADDVADRRVNSARSHERSMTFINNVLNPLANHTGPYVSTKRSIF